MIDVDLGPYTAVTATIDGRVAEVVVLRPRPAHLGRGGAARDRRRQRRIHERDARRIAEAAPKVERYFASRYGITP